MLSTSDVVIIGGSLLAFALVSGRLARTPATSAMLFTVVGFLVGADVFDLLDVAIDSSALRLLAEATLALVLFSDASAIDTRRLARERATPLRLLGVALPLSIIVGALAAAVFFPDLDLFEAAALAILLAPTDAALGEAVVADTRLPSTLRQGLNVESGLNDGVCVPLLIGALALAELEEAPGFDGGILRDLVRELAIAVAVGFAIALVVAVASRWSARHRWVEESWARIVPLVTTALAYVVTVDLGGSGFIASFVAGLVFGRILGPATHPVAELTEDLGQALSAITFLFFGATMVGPSLSAIDLRTVVYAVASLTVVRMVPVALSLIGTGAAPRTVLFAGWFGPRGLATIVFALTVVEESSLPGTDRIVHVATFTVLLSVFAHGLSAHGLVDGYVGWYGVNHDRLTFETAVVDVRTPDQRLRRSRASLVAHRRHHRR
jgi:NhaP-type Na+/H+ or K+/H+ antiporter